MHFLPHKTSLLVVFSLSFEQQGHITTTNWQQVEQHEVVAGFCVMSPACLCSLMCIFVYEPDINKTSLDFLVETFDDELFEAVS